LLRGPLAILAFCTGTLAFANQRPYEAGALREFDHKAKEAGNGLRKAEHQAEHKAGQLAYDVKHRPYGRRNVDEAEDDEGLEAVERPQGRAKGRAKGKGKRGKRLDADLEKRFPIDLEGEDVEALDAVERPKGRAKGRAKGKGKRAKRLDIDDE